MQKKLTFILLCLTLMILSCSKNSAEKKQNITVTQNPPQITIGFSIDSLAIERWRRDTDVFLATAKELGANVIVQNAGNSVDEQIRQIKYLIDKKVDCLVIVPKKADSLVEVISEARSNNIPVISYDRLTLNSDINLYLTIDSEKVGSLMAKEILKQMPYGTLYCIYGPQEDFNMAMIKSGVERTLYGSQLRIGHIFYTDSWNYDLSYQEMISLLRQNKIPNAIICGNDAVADSVIRAITELRPNAKIAIAGQDADIANCQHVVNGKQTVTIYKPITELSKQAAYCAVMLSKGHNAEDLPLVNAQLNNGYAEIPTLLLDPIAVTKENIDEVVIDSGFHTREEVYRE
ncbi:substrate-binding domain-containing protein [Treponema sp.]|uniref:substrate-binding domain-containing protein n=1 Tax=Treponema sp. TaxID=166 RepID=UPI00298EBC1F|nr:substrate-binding domain-containing protein [Treponema sp.]MCR5612573.1 substrate-binding domain-containing protein [Treponema sp.]